MVAYMYFMNLLIHKLSSKIVYDTFEFINLHLVKKVEEKTFPYEKFLIL